MSVICIFFQAERYFREAIDSVLAQDFGDFELLLVDDGSTDGSTKMAKEYESADPDRIRYFEHPRHANRGMSATRNLGLSHARGDFIAFIDADDRWRPSKLAEQVALLDRMPEVDAVCGSVNYWSSHDGGKDQIILTGHVRNRPIAPPEAIRKMYPVGKATAPSISDLLFRRPSIVLAGGFEDSFKGAYEDQAFLAKFYLRSTLYVATRIWSDYRLHPASCMADVDRNGTYHEIRLAFLEWFEGYLASTRGPHDTAIQRALTRSLRPYRAAQGKRLRNIVRTLPFAVPAVRAGRAALDRLRPLLAPGPSILMYHRIAEESFDPWGIAVSSANFADQLEWIARYRTMLPLPEFAELHRRGKLPRNALALTFDDGYACNGIMGGPLLERFGVPATIFLPPVLIDLGREFWWDELQRIVWGATQNILRLDGHEVRLGDLQADDKDWAFAEPPRTPRQSAYHRLWSRLYALRPRDLDAAMAQLRGQARVPDAPRESHRLLTRQEVRSLRSDLVEFGSHALTHPSLPLLGTEEKAREINAGKEQCAELTGIECRSFAYPYGNLDGESRRLVEQAGFACACKADGWFVRRGSDRFALPRIRVGNWASGELAKLIGRG